MFVLDSVKNSDEAVRGLYGFVEGQHEDLYERVIVGCLLESSGSLDAVPSCFLFETEGNGDL